MGSDVNIWMWIAGQLIAGAAIWGGIRVDLRNMHKDIERAHSDIDKLDGRIDRIMESRNRG